jgi:hypothetical protein
VYVASGSVHGCAFERYRHETKPGSSSVLFNAEASGARGGRFAPRGGSGAEIEAHGVCGIRRAVRVVDAYSDHTRGNTARGRALGACGCGCARRRKGHHPAGRGHPCQPGHELHVRAANRPGGTVGRDRAADRAGRWTGACAGVSLRREVGAADLARGAPVGRSRVSAVGAQAGVGWTGVHIGPRVDRRRKHLRARIHGRGTLGVCVVDSRVRNFGIARVLGWRPYLRGHRRVHLGHPDIADGGVLHRRRAVAVAARVAARGVATDAAQRDARSHRGDERTDTGHRKRAHFDDCTMRAQADNVVSRLQLRIGGKSQLLTAPAGLLASWVTALPRPLESMCTENRMFHPSRVPAQ